MVLLWWLTLLHPQTTQGAGSNPEVGKLVCSELVGHEIQKDQMAKHVGAAKNKT